MTDWLTFAFAGRRCHRSYRVAQPWPERRVAHGAQAPRWGKTRKDTRKRDSEVFRSHVQQIGQGLAYFAEGSAGSIT